MLAILFDDWLKFLIFVFRFLTLLSNRDAFYVAIVFFVGIFVEQRHPILKKESCVTHYQRFENLINYEPEISREAFKNQLKNLSKDYG